jgi:hypothetical protein
MGNPVTADAAACPLDEYCRKTHGMTYAQYVRAHFRLWRHGDAYGDMVQQGEMNPLFCQYAELLGEETRVNYTRSMNVDMAICFANAANTELKIKILFTWEEPRARHAEIAVFPLYVDGVPDSRVAHAALSKTIVATMEKIEASWLAYKRITSGPQFDEPTCY